MLDGLLGKKLLHIGKSDCLRFKLAGKSGVVAQERQDTAATDGGSISGVGPGAGVAVINPANRERLVRQLFGALNGVDFHDFGTMDSRAPCAGSSARD